MRMYEFVGQVQNGARLASMEQALMATRATLETLAERLGADDSRHLAAQLPDGIGQYLDGVVRKPIVRALVHLARGPAHAAGFGGLQEFLERGLAAFERMGGAATFLNTIRDRERQAMVALLETRPDDREPDRSEGTAG